jgi:hypothetical protein
MQRIVLAIALGGALCGCATHRAAQSHASVSLSEPVTTWRDKVVLEDLAWIDTLPAHRIAARALAERRGRPIIAAEKALLEDPALDHAPLPPGSYRCRMVRLGATTSPRGIRVLPPFFCYVRGESDNLLTFAKQTGTDLPGGWLYPDDDKRYVFLGARQQRPGDTSLAYGAIRTRDVVGVVERIGSFRWRLEIRAPARDSLDVYELTPVPAEDQPPQPSAEIAGRVKR